MSSVLSERVVPLGKEYSDVLLSCWDCDTEATLPKYGDTIECGSCDSWLDFDDRVNKDLPEPSWAPTFSDIHRWMNGSENAMALDECEVEPDGHCEHGSPSWIRHLGLI